MIDIEEKIIFIAELNKLHDDYRKCFDLYLRQQIEKDIVFLEHIILKPESESDDWLHTPKNPQAN